MALQDIRLVTFDVTNTLLKFRQPPWHFYASAARDYGYKGTESELRDPLLQSYKLMNTHHPNFGKNSIGWEEWWRHVVKLTLRGHLPHNAKIDIIASNLIDEFRTEKCWCLAKGGEKLLNMLHEHQVHIGVVSNFDPRLTDILINTGLYEHFDFVMPSYQAGCTKPDKEIFNLALNQFQESLQPKQCIHVGDDVHKDYFGARSADWHALLVTNRKVSSEIPPAAHHVFKNLNRLRRALCTNKTLLDENQNNTCWSSWTGNVF